MDLLSHGHRRILGWIFPGIAGLMIALVNVALWIKKKYILQDVIR